MPRFCTPRSATDVGLGVELSPSSAVAARSCLNHKHSWEARSSPPRNRKRVFHYTTDSEMETYRGQVRAPADAVVLFEACRMGLLPRVQRRLSEKERQSIKSGSVFVWDEREAGMRRWTDGKSWSASRVSGSFLTYREMEGRRGGGGSGFPNAPANASSSGARTPESGRGNDSEVDAAGADEGPDAYRYKPDGLLKQSFSITTSTGNHLHLISYYSRSQPDSQQLPIPTTDPQLRHIRPAKGMYPESTVHENQNIPAVTRSPMAHSGYQVMPAVAGYARPQPHWSSQAPHHTPWSPVAAPVAPPPLHAPSGSAPPAPQQHAYGGHGYYGQPLVLAGTANGQTCQPYPQSGPSHLSHPHTPQNAPRIDNRRPPLVPEMSDPTPTVGDARRQNSSEGYSQTPYDPKNYPPRSATTCDTAYGHTHSPPQPARAYNNGYPPVGQPCSPSPPTTYSVERHGQGTAAAYAQHPAPQYPPSASAQLHIDPRLSSPPSAQSGVLVADQSRAPGSTQSASAVPNINSLINAASDHSYSSPMARSPSGPSMVVNGHGFGSRNTSAPTSASTDRSPTSGIGVTAVKKEAPQDIPSEKVGFSEDMRALKVLDKGFR